MRKPVVIHTVYSNLIFIITVQIFSVYIYPIVINMSEWVFCKAMYMTIVLLSITSIV